MKKLRVGAGTVARRVVSQHYAEDDLILYYYGEAPGGAARSSSHLDRLRVSARRPYREFAAHARRWCRRPKPPERGEQHGLEVWQRIRHRLPGAGRAVVGIGVGCDGIACVLVVRGRRAGHRGVRRRPRRGRVSRRRRRPRPRQLAGISAQPAASTTGGSAILLTSVADHLDRVGADPHRHHGTRRTSRDISAEQRLGRGSRCRRAGSIGRTPVDAGEQSVAAVLDELERSLLEIVHSPSQRFPRRISIEIRRRIDAAALLFKVRVMSDELRQREGAAADRQRPAIVNSATQDKLTSMTKTSNVLFPLLFAAALAAPAAAQPPARPSDQAVVAPSDRGRWAAAGVAMSLRDRGRRRRRRSRRRALTSDGREAIEEGSDDRAVRSLRIG